MISPSPPPLQAAGRVVEEEEVGGGSSRLGSGAQPTTARPSFSQENGLRIKPAFFEVCRFAPRERGDATSEHTRPFHTL